MHFLDSPFQSLQRPYYLNRDLEKKSDDDGVLRKINSFIGWLYSFSDGRYSLHEKTG